MKLSDEEVAKAADALRRGDALAAAHICLSASNTFFDSLVADVEYVLTRTPQALSDCPNEILQPLRIAAGLMILGGYAHPIRRFIAADTKYSYRYTPETVAHLLTNHASFLRNRASIADVGLNAVKILGGGLPDECSACRQISQRRFTVADAPELPVTDCTCPGGCKCVLVAVACDQCGKRGATSVAKLNFGKLKMIAALCDACARTPRADYVFRNRVAELRTPSKTTKSQKATIFVVVEILPRDDYYANQPLKTPIAAFLKEASASKFVASKRSQFISLDWEVIPVPYFNA